MSQDCIHLAYAELQALAAFFDRRKEDFRCHTIYKGKLVWAAQGHIVFYKGANHFPRRRHSMA